MSQAYKFTPNKQQVLTAKKEKLTSVMNAFELII